MRLGRKDPSVGELDAARVAGVAQPIDDPPAVDELLDGDQPRHRRRRDRASPRRSHSAAASPGWHRMTIIALGSEARTPARSRARPAESAQPSDSFSASFRSFSSLAAWLLPWSADRPRSGRSSVPMKCDELLHRLLERREPLLRAAVARSAPVGRMTTRRGRACPRPGPCPSP